jgi:hypothetical protein
MEPINNGSFEGSNRAPLSALSSRHATVRQVDQCSRHLHSNSEGHEKVVGRYENRCRFIAGL